MNPLRKFSFGSNQPAEAAIALSITDESDFVDALAKLVQLPVDLPHPRAGLLISAG